MEPRLAMVAFANGAQAMLSGDQMMVTEPLGASRRASTTMHVLAVNRFEVGAPVRVLVNSWLSAAVPASFVPVDVDDDSVVRWYETPPIVAFRLRTVADDGVPLTEEGGVASVFDAEERHT